jgi:RNA polymerase sigma-70 factor (sigma-E family)
MDAVEASATVESIENLYRQHAPRAAALAYLLTSDWHLAEDLAQEAFVRATGRFQHLRDPQRFDAYLHRTVVNLHRSVLRRRRLERHYLAGQRPGIPEEADDVEGRDELVRALRALPPRQRAAVVLRHCMDLSEAQVADVLQCSVGAAKNLVARGIRALREQMRGEDL